MPKHNHIRLECHIKISTPKVDIAALLATDSGLSKQQIKHAINKGALWLSHGKHTQRLRRTKRVLTIGDELHLYYNQTVLESQVSDAELIEDLGQYSIWYKPYGMLCQGSKWGDHTTINRYAETRLTPQRPAFIIHRLDKAATGLVLIGHSKKTTAALAKLFQLRQLDKYYQVIVEGKFCQGQGAALIINTDVDGKAACSHATLLNYDAIKDRSLVQVKIDSGRKHQIRIHMASIGHPIVGDRLHGSGNVALFDGQNETTKGKESLGGAAKDPVQLDLQLSSCYLKFACPITGTIREFSLPARLRPEL